MRGVIFLIYYDRPRLVHNALLSIRNLNYDDFEVHVIDDGSPSPLRPIVEQYYPDLLPLFEFYRCDDTPAQKVAQGGSRFGAYLNLAIELSIGDFGILLCDDDALMPDYFTNLNAWFLSHPDKVYCYSHVVDFNPITQVPGDYLPRVGITNPTGAINGYCRIDASQVAWRLSASRNGGVLFPPLQTESLDAVFFQAMFATYGPVLFAGFFGQFKARFPGQLSEHLGDPYSGTERG